MAGVAAATLLAASVPAMAQDDEFDRPHHHWRHMEGGDGFIIHRRHWDGDGPRWHHWHHWDHGDGDGWRHRHHHWDDGDN
jgi:hypothetical protein